MKLQSYLVKAEIMSIKKAAIILSKAFSSNREENFYYNKILLVTCSLIM